MGLGVHISAAAYMYHKGGVRDITNRCSRVVSFTVHVAMNCLSYVTTVVSTLDEGYNVMAYT